jgi:hypothetical protein
MKNTLLIGLGILLIFWYFSDKSSVPIGPVGKIRATYIGPDIMHTGNITKMGDTITGILNSDGSMTYVLTGNGIVASAQTFNIPASRITNIVNL